MKRQKVCLHKNLGIFLLTSFLVTSLSKQAFSSTDPNINNTLSALEIKILGQHYPGQAVNTRLSRLESALHQPSIAKASTAYRLERLYTLQDAQLSQKAVTLAIQAYNRGIDAAGQGRYEAAIESYRQSVQLNPTFLLAYNNLGSLLEHLQRYGEAIAVYEKALQKTQEKSSEPIALLHRNLGILYEKVGSIEKSLSEYQRYLKLTRTPDPTISKIVAQYVIQRKQGHSAPDYTAIILRESEGKSLLWSHQLNPITVYVVLDEDQVPFLPAVQEALKQWETGSNNRLRFREVGTLSQARIVVHLKEGPLSHPNMEVGHASYDVSPDPQTERKLNLRVAITVNTGERDVPIPLADRLAQVKRLALHELGHAIGIWGHSPDPGDIMYARPIASTLSLRDIQTLRKLYQLEDRQAFGSRGAPALGSRRPGGMDSVP